MPLMPSEDVRKKANWDSLFDTYKVKIATLIYNIRNCITPSCVEHVIQRKESKYDLRHQRRVSVQRFETYYMKNSISYRGSIAWNLLEPSAVSARDYAKRAKSLTPSETWTLMKGHRKYILLYKLFRLLLTTLLFFSNLYIDTSVVFLSSFLVHF